MDPVQRGYRIKGRVQGVFFRAWTEELANGLGLRGTVRNLPDGSVEAHAAGALEALAAFEVRLWKGHPSARVEGVERLASTHALPEGPFRVLR